jgi:anti-anti-sigma factor
MYTSVPLNVPLAVPQAHYLAGQRQHGNRRYSRPGYIVDCDGARLQVHARAMVTVVTIRGHIDAANTAAVNENIHCLLAQGRPLILDLRELTSLGVQALRALLNFHDASHRAGVSWSLVAVGPVQRLLSIADRENRLPVVNSLDEALRQLTADCHTGSRQLLRIVAFDRLCC